MPAYLDTARAFYGEAFDHKKKRDLARSIEEWAEMDEDEQSFAVAHLLYLNLHAQAAGHRLLAEVRDLLDEVAESLADVVDGEEDEDQEVPSAPEVDGFAVDGGDSDPDGVRVETEPDDGAPVEDAALVTDDGGAGGEVA